MRVKDTPPFAPVLMESTRAMGYSLEAAVADIIDNSIAASAGEVDVYFSPYDAVPYVAILDDGTGMSSDQIDDAMRYGSQSSLNIRGEQDLGRFGLGLKTASLSQCRCLTVISKQGRKVVARRWDLDEIYKRSSWALISLDREDLEGIPQYVNLLKPMKQGTLVIWESLDRMLGGTTNPEKLMNKQIRKLLNLFSDWSYVGVTATPFANIFILPEKNEEMENEDLFPSDYIYALDAPTNYIGGNELFGDKAPYEKSLVTINDAAGFFPYGHKQDIFIPDLPDSLYDALRYFLLANVVRDIKGDETTHRSMLVNVSRFVKVQDRISTLILEWLYEAVRDIKSYCQLDEEHACKNEIMRQLRDDWYEASYPFFNELGLPWETVQKQWLLKAVSAIEVRTINQKSSTKMLDYGMYSENGLRVIAVGGLSLSRGLTLEGLMVSYFHRNSQMYDTLMQMGRWFGYRSGYEKLFRVWMPDDAIGWYAHITQASNELREEIAKMNRLGAIPRDFGLKVRAHPTTLIITARNKMKHSDRVERWITLDGKFFETPRFRHEIEVIRANKQRTDELIGAVFDSCGTPEGSHKQPLFWSKVPRDIICDYLRKYENHPRNMEADGTALENYIRKNNKFAYWDVLVVSNDSTPAFFIKGMPIRPSKPQMSRSSGVLSAYGTKMRIGSMGLTRYGLTDKQIKQAKADFKESKRAEYELKYGNRAEEKLQAMSTPDRAYLIQDRDPILIIHYMKPVIANESDVPKGMDSEKDLMVGYGIGFPMLADSEPVYAIYYINMVEQQQYMTDSLFLMLLILLNYGYVGETALVFSAPSQVVVTAVDGASTTLALHIIVAMFGFDFITTDITANGIFDNHYESSFLKSSCIRCAP